jgi:pimeloyl-ACP methyl ester carboxylesterase/1-acyl-sn-glycerol-3-phosphate acyltransferase
MAGLFGFTLASTSALPRNGLLSRCPNSTCPRFRQASQVMCATSSSPVHVVRHPGLVAGESSPKRSVVFLAGLDSAPLPPLQRRALQSRFRVVSVTHAVRDRSDWEEIARATTDVVCDISASARGDSTIGDVVLVGESWGAALALRVAAECARRPGGNPIERLVLINSGTALASDPILRRLAGLLPLLKLDGSGRIFYRAAALILYKGLLVDEDRVDPECVPASVSTSAMPILSEWLARTVDIDAVPLETMLHRVSLLLRHSDTFNDACIRRLVTVPTTIVASTRDRLLRSEKEAARLGQLLPSVERTVLLPESAHACLRETGIYLADWISDDTAAPMPVPKFAGGEFEVAGGTNGRMTFDQASEFAQIVLAPWEAVAAPIFYGRYNVHAALAQSKHGQRRAVLFVGNHGVYGLLDMPLLISELNRIMGDRRLRSLAHATHFDQFSKMTGGSWGRFCDAIGAVPATPRNFFRLLREGEPVLLFPGGPSEVCRRRGQKYTLAWPEKTDFVRTAAKLNAVIVPFSSVGADDAVDILADGQELQSIPVLGAMLTRALRANGFDPNHVMPLGTLPIPRNRFRFEFHAPISCDSLEPKDADACRAVYLQVQGAVEDGIQRLTADPSSARTLAVQAVNVLDDLLF